MTILVANANGKVGQEVVRGLLAKGEKVRVGVRNMDKAKAEFPGAEIVLLDVLKPETRTRAVSGVNAVFSAFPTELLPEAETDLVAAAKAAGVRRFVKLSVVGAANGGEAFGHGPAEQAVRASGLEHTFLRPTFFMQNYSTALAPSIKSSRVFHEAAGAGKTSFVDARDIAAVAVKALTEASHNGKSYTLTGGQAIDRNEVAKLIGKAIGAPVEYVAIDDKALRQALEGAPEKTRELYSAIYGWVRDGATEAPDVENVLGRKPITFADLARDNASIWR
jgi:uncharacterized protein YbjT (DUF2867 family)